MSELSTLDLERLGRLVIEPESWFDVWPEAEALANAHFAEVDGGVEPKRVFKLDCEVMGKMAAVGILQIISARLDGRLAGYCSWNVVPDVESEGLLIAQQGAWFVGREFEPLGLGLGRKMFRVAVEHLKSMGVQCMYPHHRTQGRGSRLGAFFVRLGAKEIQHTYSLWIGD